MSASNTHSHVNPWQFSLRTAFVITTLVAVGTWLSRNVEWVSIIWPSIVYAPPLLIGTALLFTLRSDSDAAIVGGAIGLAGGAAVGWPLGAVFGAGWPVAIWCALMCGAFSASVMALASGYWRGAAGMIAIGAYFFFIVLLVGVAAFGAAM